MEHLSRHKLQILLILGISLFLLFSIFMVAYFSENKTLKSPAFQAAESEITVGELIPASLKRVRDYPSELENKTLEEIIELSRGNGETAQKAKKLKKLAEQQKRLKEKF
jgi:hypothetical protein